MAAAALQPLNLLFTREAIAAQVSAVKAKMLLVPPPGVPGGLYEKVEGLQKLAPSLERIVTLPLDGTVAFDGEPLLPEAAVNRAIPPILIESWRCCRPAVQPARLKSCRCLTAMWCRQQSDRCLPSIFNQASGS